jgi:hypothetical protein
MHFLIGIVGLGLNLAGAVMLGLAGIWFSRSVLVYLDAVEANLSKVVGVLQCGGSHFDISGINRGQNQARSLKLVGWGLLALGFLLVLIALRLGMTAWQAS